MKGNIVQIKVEPKQIGQNDGKGANGQIQKKDQPFGCNLVIKQEFS